MNTKAVMLLAFVVLGVLASEDNTSIERQGQQKMMQMLQREQ